MTGNPSKRVLNDDQDHQIILDFECKKQLERPREWFHVVSFHCLFFPAPNCRFFCLAFTCQEQPWMGVKGKPKHWKAVPQQDGFKSPISIGQTWIPTWVVLMGLLLDPRFSDHKIRRCFVSKHGPVLAAIWVLIPCHSNFWEDYENSGGKIELKLYVRIELIPQLTQFQRIFRRRSPWESGIPRPALHDPRIAGFATYTIGASFSSTSSWKVSNGRSKNESTCCLNFNWIYLEQTWKTTMLLNWKCEYQTSNDKLQLKSVSLANFFMANPIDQPCSMTHVRWDSVGFF